MHRFFVHKDNIKSDIVTIDDEDVKHIRNVLRLDIGDKISVCDGENNDYLVEITKISKELVEGNILEKTGKNSESPINITLYQGLPKASKMDLIIQKATELGAVKIVPTITERTIVKIQDRKKEEKKVDRWRKISKEAAKQCKRGIIPEINNIITFDEMISSLSKEKNIIVPYESENKTSMKDILKKIDVRNISIVIGPEGGFEESEIDKLKELNAHIVTLGPRILRTETAGFTAIVIVMYELGDLGVI